MTTSVGRRRLRIGACLSLTGRYARFGTQAARGLETWQALDGDADLVIEDDRSDRQTLEKVIYRVAQRSDVLLGPYSTQLIRTAGRIAAEEDWLLWNHGGSGDDVEAAHPGHLVSTLTPTSRYAEPFLQHLADNHDGTKLWIAQGKGSFGRQVAEGAESQAQKLDIDATRIDATNGLAEIDHSIRWNLFSAGTFEDDVDLVKQAQDHANPPQMICAVAAGVRDFANMVHSPVGVFGVAQWFPGSSQENPTLGPTEATFLAKYASLTEGATPDYPAVQAAATAVLATQCARQAGSTAHEDLWSAAMNMDTTTLFGEFGADPSSGAQIKHRMVLLGWTPHGLTAI